MISCKTEPTIILHHYVAGANLMIQCIIPLKNPTPLRMPTMCIKLYVPCMFNIVREPTTYIPKCRRNYYPSSTCFRRTRYVYDQLDVAGGPANLRRAQDHCPGVQFAIRMGYPDDMAQQLARIRGGGFHCSGLSGKIQISVQFHPSPISPCIVSTRIHIDASHCWW